MFYLHVSNRTENLLRHLCEVIRVDKQPRLFDKELFLIQSQGMERMVAQTLADEFISFCNFHFFLPLDFLNTVAARIGTEVGTDGFQRQVLSWRIESLLRELEGDVYQPLRLYLEGENKELKRFQLAQRLANLYDQYQLMRGDMLSEWGHRQKVTANPAENWQIDLWRRLLAQPEGALHRGVLFHKVIERLLDKKDLSSLLPRRISVFGLHTMPPVYLQFLNGLARHMDVHLFVLSPCENYWGNIESPRMQYQRLTRKTKTPDSEEILEHHPLLAALGKQGRDLQNMMLELADFTLEFTSYEDPLCGKTYGDATLLQRIQKDLLDAEFHEQAAQPTAADDRSVQLVSCHSRMRELMVLKDQLLDLLHKDSSLQLRDIIVMAPDVQEYSSLIPAVFDDIQHSIADRSTRRRNSVIGAFVAFLELFSRRFGVTEVMDVLHLPVVYPQFDLTAADLETLEQWVSDAGIRWGLSAAHREESGIVPYEETTWRAGLDRLLMGYAIDSDTFIDGILPYTELEGRGAAPLGGLCRFVHLLEQGYGDFQKSYPLTGWSELLLTYVGALFGEEYEQEYVELLSLVSELGETAEHFHCGDVSFTVICEWVKRVAKESRSSSGFLRGQLTFCSMLPMRSIPFRVVCLIGLNDGAFPKDDRHDTFDLMAAEMRPGDRSHRADDHYQFLEAILAARETLYISFVGQSRKNNEKIPPSVVVEEFIEVLEKKYGIAKNPVVHHPLHPFSSRYFKAAEDTQLFSYDENFCTIARAFMAEEKVSQPWWQGCLEPVGEEVDLSNLLAFYRNPQQYFVKNRLGIRLEEGVVLPEDQELFQVVGLDKYRIERYLLELVSAKPAPHPDETAQLLKKVQVTGYWPLGAVGSLTFKEKYEQVETFWDTVRSLSLGNSMGEHTVDLRLGPHKLLGKLTGLYENGVLVVRFGRLRGQDLLSGWIHHLVADRLFPGKKTFLVTTEGCYQFADTVISGNGPSLELLLEYFREGCRRVWPLYVEPAFAYAGQQASRRARKPPIVKAAENLQYSLENGYQPEWMLLLSGGEKPIEPGSEFEELAQNIMVPIWEAANG